TRSAPASRSPAGPESHLLPRGGIAHEIADAQDADDRPVGGIVEPLGGHLDETGPADRLRQAIPDPRQREHRHAAARSEAQREEHRAPDADEEVAPAAPVVTEA